MSSVEEILALREELARKQAENKQGETEAIEAQRQTELDKEAERLRREIAEQDQVAALLAGAGQNPEKTETFGVQRTEEEILFAADVAKASALGVPQEEIDKEVAARKAETSTKAETETAPVKAEPVKEEAPKAEAPRLSVSQPAVNTGTKEEEK